MSNEVINPYQQFLDDANNPLENGTIQFNTNLTTSIATIYSDEALTVAQDNPYPLDATGRIIGNVRYAGLMRLVVKDESGATIRTLDNVSTMGDAATDITYSPGGTVGARLDSLNFSTRAEILALTPADWSVGDSVYLNSAGNFIVRSGTISDSSTGIQLSSSTWSTASKYWELDSVNFPSVADFLASSPGSDTANIVGYSNTYLTGTVAQILAGPKGGHKRHKTGATVATTSVPNAANSTEGTAANGNAGYSWTKDGVEWFYTIEKGVLFVDNFGALGNDTSSSATANLSAINSAIACSYALTDPFPKVVFGFGVYYINGPIDRTGTGNYVDLEGQGMRGTYLRATGSTFACMIDTDDTGNTTGRTHIQNMSIDADSIADYCIDAQNMRYWTLYNTELRNAVVAGLRGGNWVTRIINNTFDGCPVGFIVDGVQSNLSASNNLLIKENSFTTCPIGLQLSNFGNTTRILNNQFDLCEDAGIWVKKGGREVDIVGNTFERCGKNESTNGTGVTVLLSGATSENMAAAIVISHDYTAQVNSLWSGVIKENNFANVNSDRCIALYNVEDGYIDENFFVDGYSTDTFVELRAHGVSSSTGRKLVIKGAYDSAVVGQLLELNGTSAQGNHCNIVVDNQEVAASNRPKFYVNNPTSAMFSNAGGTPTINETYYGGFKEFEFDSSADGASRDKVLSIDFTTLADHALLGRYIRVHYQTKGSSADTGVRCRVSVSGAGILDIQRTSNSGYIEAGRGHTVYIPSTATSFELRLDALSASNSSKMIGFCVCDAAYDIATIPIAV